VDSAHTVRVQEHPMHTHVDGPQVIPNVHLADCLLRPYQGLGLPASNPTDLNKQLPRSSQTACIRLVIAHMYPASDAHQCTREVPELRALHNTTLMRTSLSPLQ